MKITLTESQTKIVINALYDLQFEKENYMRSSKVGDTPSLEESCCAYHLMRYEQQLASYNSLKDYRNAITKVIKIFEEK